METEYGNEDVKTYTYDTFGNLASVGNGTSTQYTWTYDSAMNPMTHIDNVNSLRYNYDYDGIGRLVRQELRTANNATHLGATEFTYDLRNNVTKVTNEIGGRTANQWYSYSKIDGVANSERYAKDNLPVRYSMSSSRYIDYSYDTINRFAKKTLSTNTPLTWKYVYKMSDRDATKPESDTTSYRTTQILSEYSGRLAYNYSYDAAGNITSMRYADGNGSGGKLNDWTAYRSYTYDSLGHLTSETNATTGKTYTYTYDNVGNITSKSDGTSTIAYTYGTDSDAGWSKLLTSYNGESIDYDAIGNPTTYRGANLTWTGRQLNSYSKGNTSIAYKYDADGLRGSKTVNGAKTTYQYLDGKLYYEDRNGTDIYYYYDSYGTISAITAFLPDGRSGTVFVGTNSLGDVNALYDGNGNIVVRYEYDAWGKVLAETNANGNALTGTAATWNEINPFRYRGYVYDAETGLYYNNSRYYDAEVGRFVNLDKIDVLTASTNSLTDKNLFAYCDNNPIMRKDTNGAFWETAIDVVSLCVSVAEVMANPADPWAWAGLAGDALDLVPFVTGLGELTKVAKVTVKAVDNTDDVIKATRNLSKATGIKKFTGSYEIMFESGNNYVGKGGLYRSTVSAKFRSITNNNDRVTSISWTPSSNTRNAYISEYNLMKVNGVNNDNTYNRIWSPGRRIIQSVWSCLFGG